MLMVTQYNKKLNDHGVSEAIGFMLIFTIIIAGIALVTLYGYPLLLQQQVSADEKIMEKNMIVLQNDVKSLAFKTVPFKETSLKIGGGSLTVYNSSYEPSSSNITIKDLGTTYVDAFKPGELRYESVSSQTDISLQNGAVVMRPQISKGPTNGSVMISEPRWFYDANTNTLVINLINITTDNIRAKEGIGTVQMALGETNYTFVKIPANNDVTIVYSPDSRQDYSVAWDNYFMKNLNNPPAMTVSRIGTPGTGQKLTYTLTQTGIMPKTLVIKKYEVQIKNI
jgi:hypothetical protein